MEIARELARDPWGRFGGREGKMARIARMEAEAAAKASEALNETLGEVKAEKREKEKEKKEVPKKKEAEAEAEEKESSRKEKGKSKAPIIIPPSLASTPETPATPLYKPHAGWWGNFFFVHAGRLEGISSDEKAKKKDGGDPERGFTDADQEALAERTTVLKAAGKRGLGATSSKKEKAVGHDWKGSKVVFGDDDCGNADGEGGDDEREKKKQKKEKEREKSKKAPLVVSSLKWKKAAESVLSQDSGEKARKKKGLSVSKLASRVAAALVSKAAAGKKTSASSSTTKEELEAALGDSLRSLCELSSRFEVDKKGRVKLAAKK